MKRRKRMYNKVIIVGHLTRDIEIRYTQTGTTIAGTAIATSRKWKNQNGEQQEETMFIDVSFFGKVAEIASKYLHKGSKVLLDGRLKFEQWTSQDGSKRSKHVLVVETMQMLDTKKDAQQGQQQYQQQGQQYGGQQQYNQQQNQNYGGAQAQQPAQRQHQIPEIDVDSDEIPF